jgi:hypothetical protein
MKANRLAPHGPCPGGNQGHKPLVTRVSPQFSPLTLCRKPGLLVPHSLTRSEPDEGGARKSAHAERPS